MRFTDLPTPCFIIDENRLVQNLAVLRDVARRSGAKILLAQKAFSMFSTYPLLREYLAGTTASGLFEARLGHEEFGGETHVYSPAYTPDEFHEILNYADHIVFNSFTQWKKYGNLARVAGKSCGLRLNPECSTQPDDHAIYDPCGPTSRLGITEANFQPDLLDGIEGFHFHTLCEQNADDLVRTVAAFEMRFGRYMEGMKWLNLGGGHHITRADYDVDALVNCIIYLRDKYKVQIYLEPGEEMKCEDLLKSVIIPSSNDAAVTLAERVSGSVQAFVVRMNERAKELGMESSSFENPTGLDDNVTNHVTSAYDIALMSRELLKHKKILEYTSIWMDTIRDGAFGLTNTNRLIRFYSGATGLKTGSTSKAKFCISATAERDGMHLIQPEGQKGAGEERDETVGKSNVQKKATQSLA